MPTDNPTCGTCRWWFEGECHRYPPQIEQGSWDEDHSPAFWLPETRRNSFCGEHQPREGEREA